MADQHQPHSAEELFAFVTILQAEIQQLHDSQNGNGGGGGGGDGGGDDDGNVPNYDDDTNSQGSDNHDHNNTPQTVRTETHVSDTVSGRPNRPTDETILSLM
ncbi:hypothetical protein PIB30_099814, partial [Stylosanthes scabra]|nr:hypothetical protein [Stylosanthes scabra]